MVDPNSESVIKEMAQKIRSGWRMLQSHCPLCHNVLLMEKGATKSYCASCRAYLVTEAQIVQEGLSLSSHPPSQMSSTKSGSAEAVPPHVAQVDDSFDYDAVEEDSKTYQAAQTQKLYQTAKESYANQLQAASKATPTATDYDFDVERIRQAKAVDDNVVVGDKHANVDTTTGSTVSNNVSSASSTPAAEMVVTRALSQDSDEEIFSDDDDFESLLPHLRPEYRDALLKQRQTRVELAGANAQHNGSTTAGDDLPYDLDLDWERFVAPPSPRTSAAAQRSSDALAAKMLQGWALTQWSCLHAAHNAQCDAPLVAPPRHAQPGDGQRAACVGCGEWFALTAEGPVALEGASETTAKAAVACEASEGDFEATEGVRSRHVADSAPWNAAVAFTDNDALARAQEQGEREEQDARVSTAVTEPTAAATGEEEDSFEWVDAVAEDAQTQAQREREAAVTSALGARMLTGWTLLGAQCIFSECVTPMVFHKKKGVVECVACGGAAKASMNDDGNLAVFEELRAGQAPEAPQAATVVEPTAAVAELSTRLCRHSSTEAFGPDRPPRHGVCTCSDVCLDEGAVKPPTEATEDDSAAALREQLRARITASVETAVRREKTRAHVEEEEDVEEDDDPYAHLPLSQRPPLEALINAEGHQHIARSRLASTLLADMLAQGWCMENLYCSDCNTPFVRKGDRSLCPVCDQNAVREDATDAAAEAAAPVTKSSPVAPATEDGASAYVSLRRLSAQPTPVFTMPDEAAVPASRRASVVSPPATTPVTTCLPAAASASIPSPAMSSPEPQAMPVYSETTTAALNALRIALEQSAETVARVTVATTAALDRAATAAVTPAGEERVDTLAMRLAKLGDAASAVGKALKNVYTPPQ